MVMMVRLRLCDENFSLMRLGFFAQTLFFILDIVVVVIVSLFSVVFAESRKSLCTVYRILRFFFAKRNASKYEMVSVQSNENIHRIKHQFAFDGIRDYEAWQLWPVCHW